MMKKLKNTFIASIMLLMLLLISCTSFSETSSPHFSMDSMEISFRNVPSQIRIGAYWYWINDNISEDGVIKDLYAMKKAGINRVQMANVQEGSVPKGNVPFLSKQWWNITKTAMRTASELDIEVGQFNSPGWSQSGGPWIPEERSMRYVAFSDTILAGGKHTINLPEVRKDQIISAYAYRTLKGREKTFVSPVVPKISMNLDSVMCIRSISVKSNKAFKGEMTLFGDDGRIIKTFQFDRRNTNINVGFNPLAPVVITIPEVSGKKFILGVNGKSDAELSITLSERPQVERYAEKSLAKLCPETLPAWDYYMWEDAPVMTDNSGTIPVDGILSLEKEISKDGKVLSFELGEGNWTVSVAYMKTTGITNSPATKEATGLEVDKLSREHVTYHIDSYIGTLIDSIPEEDRRSFKFSIMDSYEMGGQNWTDDFRSRFIDTYDYDPVPFLPTLQGIVVGNNNISDRFLWDVRRLVADMIASEYVGGLADAVHKYNLSSWLENYGHWGFPSEFLLYGSYSDEIAGEFWSDGSTGSVENRLASSCGHIYGKNVIWAESCTSGGPQFSRYPKSMKARIDRVFAEGVNNSLLHLYIQQPDDRKPGIDAWFGNEFNRNNSWFENADVFTDYLRRCNYMLQQGRYVAQVAYFIGEDAPKMAGECNPTLPKGCSYDFINADVLKNHASVKNTKLVLDSGMEYDVLVLPRQSTMRPEMLKCLYKMAGEGLRIIGPKPLTSPSLQNIEKADEYIAQTAEKMWKMKNVYPEGTRLEDLNIPVDFSCQDSTGILFLHRTLGEDGDIYFISNQNEYPVEFLSEFNVNKSLYPEVWNPITGEIKRINWDGESLRLNLDIVESCFVVFRKDGKNQIKNSKEKASATEIHGPWIVNFHESAGNAAFSVVMNTLEDWSKSSDERIKYFSGTAEYHNTFNITDSTNQVILDFLSVMVVGKVWINDQYVGGVWSDPYKIDISEFVKKGANTIKVVVSNNWRNRLIGESRLDIKDRKLWTNINPWNSPDKELQPSGIIGPIILMYSPI